MPIRIPEQYYVGYRKQEDDLPLGFATPHGTDSAAAKRMATVDSWSDNDNTRDIIDNVLVEGFKLGDSVRRYGWGKGNVLWRIADPRGFELEISSPNLASILACTTIVNGAIQGRCVWGRDGAVNVLLPEESEPYREAVAMTKIGKSNVKLSEVNNGDLVLLKDGTQALVVGEVNIMASHSTGSGYRTKRTLAVQRKRYVLVTGEHLTAFLEGKATLEQILTPNIEQQHGGRRWYRFKVEFVGSPNVSAMVKQGAASVDMANVARILNEAAQEASGHYFGFDKVYAVTLTPFKTLSMELVDAPSPQDDEFVVLRNGYGYSVTTKHGNTYSYNVNAFLRAPFDYSPMESDYTRTPADYTGGQYIELLADDRRFRFSIR